jgi:excisionase family DNA binding protein
MMRNDESITTDRMLLTSDEASRYLAISPRKLWGMTASGQIPHVRIGRCVRYSVEDLQRWIDQRKRGGDVE